MPLYTTMNISKRKIGALTGATAATSSSPSRWVDPTGRLASIASESRVRIRRRERYVFKNKNKTPAGMNPAARGKSPRGRLGEPAVLGRVHERDIVRNG
jgi:hypothetical protein